MSSSTSAMLAAAAFAVLSLCAACDRHAPEKSPAPEALCPPTMKGGPTEVLLSDLYLQRSENDSGWKNIPFAGNANHKEWALASSKDVTYRAVCDYDGEVIGVSVDAAFRRCWFEPKSGSSGSAMTACERR